MNAERVVKAAEKVIDAALLLLFLCFFILGAYAAADIAGIYLNAAPDKLKTLRPAVVSDGEGGGRLSSADFSELRELNPDVRGWLTLDGCGVDYPLLQSDNNIKYLNTDVYGQSSLSGSIFMDYRCPGDFSGALTTVYGHHMTGGVMFGGLDKYREQAFLDEHHGGVLLTPDGVSHELEIVCALLTSASDREIFVYPTNCKSAAELPAGLDAPGRTVLTSRTPRLPLDGSTSALALTTCTNYQTNERLVIIALMRK